MRIQSAEFVVGAVGEKNSPVDELPEVAFAGRSNVGKSSLINRLVQRRKLAHTSSTPGRTQQLNYYRVNDRIYLVDLPGYGYVRGGVDLRRALGRLTEKYLGGRRQLRAVVLLIDARHGPTALDLEMVGRLREADRPFLLVLTKADKLSRPKLSRQLEKLEKGGELADLAYLTFSAETGVGREDLLRWIEEVTSGDGTPTEEEGHAE
ncbi:MAG: ribosome biogenesis GTP-binding protein YihA/YsxC [Candidatus Latescibacteria bacterium]|jgi:GTP-binding protein|nr:YihA family ribosome biogenesis GTP-binding protein [Gemmatimonadaceae bacterium]MDP6019520.1 ribosome biogenesis GTP-binding protein YihA/YsxC [Candidatus Latescibacterota bacterium]MDP7450264.1 ribosome biogenesis GTP-binding protein YihA/YsxC [Candidatus Latescibacterota bacterium]HJP33932.1 ribosome biogenesis GTP-binding protein YihA/YsxC [Candidatus Latescibacterota bacterium]